MLRPNQYGAGHYRKWVETPVLLWYINIFIVETLIKKFLTVFDLSPRAVAVRAGVVGSDDAGFAVELSDHGHLLY